MIWFAKTLWLWLITLQASVAGALIGGSSAQTPGVVYFDGCTGALISPNLILTAAHCLLMTEEEGLPLPTYRLGQTLKVYGYNGSPYANGRTLFTTSIAKFAVHPSWSRRIRALGSDTADAPDVFDVGLIKLQDRLNLPLAEVVQERSKIKVGSRLHINGAGCQLRDSERHFGFLKSADVEVRHARENRLMIATSDRGTRKRAGLCKGDSGGPAFFGRKVLAVNSILTRSPKVGSTRPIRGYVSRVDQPEVQRWIQAALAFPIVGHLVFNREPQTVEEALKPYLKSVTAPAVLIPKLRRDPRFRCLSEKSLMDLADLVTASPKDTRLENLLANWATCRIAAQGAISSDY